MHDDVSIHAARVGRDLVAIKAGLLFLEVSIHAARVGRDPMTITQGLVAYLFQSTRPVWAATG